MRPIAAEMPRITEDGLLLRLGQRVFGDVGKPDHAREIASMEVPARMNVLTDVLVRDSSLLSLRAEADDQAIYDAYGHDFTMLARYRDAFEKTIRAAILARADAAHAPAREFLAPIAEQIDGISHKPSIELGAETLALPRDERLGKLQELFRNEARSFTQRVATWLHMLVESEHVCVVEWLNPTAARYHFFRMDSSEQVLGRTVHDPGMSLRGRTVTTKTRTKVEVHNERRTHTIVGARTHSLDRYTERVPHRIAELINTMPSEVRQFASIVSGTATQESVTRRLASGEIKVDEHSVFVEDPAVTLFDTFAIAGYGGSAAEPARSTYQGHALTKANRALLWSLVATGAATLMIEPFGGVRGMVMVAIVGLLLTAISQLGMRMNSRSGR